jgi:hypothetical protein
MDIQPQTTAKPISDDQELAKVLAGVTNSPDNGLNFEETPVPTPTPLPTPMPVIPQAAAPVIGYNAPSNIGNTPNASDNLENIKKDALTELRPLVDKLDLLPEEKFDIYLLLLRSTDDITLIAPAHATARSIANESKRAQALLDVIKEIDYLSNPPQPTN